MRLKPDLFRSKEIIQKNDLIKRQITHHAGKFALGSGRNIASKK
jgi:hypothetical protein